MTDWLVGLDVALTGRFRHCTLCGRVQVAFWGIMLVESVGLSIAYTLRQSCRAKDRDCQQVGALLERRYGKEPRIEAGGMDAESLAP